MRIKATIAVLVVGAAIAGAATAAPSTTGSGLYGVVMRGPVRPTCIDDQPCDLPARGVLLAFSRNGRIVARVTTARDGTYRVRLAPGRYRVTASPIPRIGTGLTPALVGVPTRFRKVDFHIDTGIQ